MQILVSTAAATIDYTIKQRLAVKVDRGAWQLATITGIRRKYVDILFDDGDEGEFDKVGDRSSVKILPKGTRKNKATLSLAEVKELMETPIEIKPKAKAKAKPQVTRRVMDMTETVPVKKPEPVVPQKGRPIAISMKTKAVPAIDKSVAPVITEPKGQSTGTLKTRLKEHDDRPIHPIDLNKGMVIQFALNASLVTALLLTYDEEAKKWNAVLLRENSKIIQVSPHHCFTHKAPLTQYEKLWAGKYMRRLEEMES